MSKKSCRWKMKGRQMKVRIAVLQRGWVFVGKYKKLKDGSRKLENAQCVRVWGTSRGLGELVNGPLPNTKLDPSGTVEYHYLTEVAGIEANADKWAKHLV